MNLRETILAADDRKPVKLPVPEWGCDIFLKPLNGHERSRIVRAASSNDSTLYGLAVVLSACDEQGNKLFTEQDIPALNEKSGAVLDRVATVIVKANGLHPGAEDDAKNA